MTCRDCRFLDVKPDAIGRRVPRRDGAYRCSWSAPEIALPTSMKQFDLQRKLASSRSYMGPDDPHDCPVREPIEGKK
jgi:hypothetical protein